MLNPWPPCSAADQDVFGPTVASSCHHGFDFTLLFEETILTLLPILLVWVAALVRLWTLRHASEKVNRSWLYGAKEIALSLNIALQLIMLALWCRESTPTTRATVPTALVAVFTSSFLLYLSHLEHIRSLRPSSILVLFFGFTIIFDLARLRTLHFIPQNQPVTFLFATSLIDKVVILVLESTEKRHLLKKGFEGSAIETTSSIINRCLLWWINDLLWKGSKTTLTVESLPVLADDIRESSDPQDLEERWERVNKYGSNALLWTFASHFKWDFIAGVIPRLAFTGFCFAQPFLVERVLDFMGEPEHVNSDNYARGLVAAYGIVYVGLAVSFATYHHKIDRMVTKMRGSLVSMIFSKTLRLSSSAVSDASAITLMSTDIERIATGLRDMHEVYSNFTEIAIALWLLARLLKIATVASTLVVIVCLAAGIPLAIASGNAQGVWLEAIEERVAVTSRVLGVMKSIKMTGLTNVLANNLRDLRSQEIKTSYAFRLYNVLILTFSFASSALSPVVGFAVFALLARGEEGVTLTNGLAFSALTLFSLLDGPMISLVDGSEDLMAVVNCFQRIQKHLMETERVDCRISHDPQAPQLINVDFTDGESNHCPSSATIRDLSASWSVDDDPVLNDLNFEVPAEGITMIVGPVGCGKSTLLKVLLGEIPECTGSVSTTFKHAAYCSQSPWITFGTVQQNIVGASPFDQRWYDRIVRVCSLQVDLQQLPFGDQTKVGVRGSRLSGGQQMRVALARALYSRQPVLILDDVLTGLDRETEKCILEAVFAAQGLMKEFRQTVILATNSAHHLPYSNYIVALGQDGSIIEKGSYDELVAAKGYVSSLDSTASRVNTERAPDIVLDDETLQELNLPDDDHADDTSRQTGDWSVYLYYFQHIGWPLLTLFVGLCGFFVLCMIAPQIWLQWWTSANETKPNENIGYWLGGYSVLGSSILLAAFLSTWVLGMVIEPKTAHSFHEVLLGTTMRATTSFLTSTDIGATTNRFSQDLELIDEELPETFESTVNGILFFIVEGFLIFVGSSYVTAAVIPFCILAVYYVARYYVRTSRQVRVLEIESKGPLFSKFLESLSGLASIRAYGWKEHYTLQNQIALDASQRPFYMLYCIQRWLSLVLDLIVAGIAVAVIAISMSLRGNSSLNMMGIALFNIVNFSGTLKMLIKEYTGLETSIGAISRIRSYVRNAKTEDLDSEVEIPPSLWPLQGDVEISNLSASYDTSSEPVLQDVNLKIRAGEKVALCGRSGSGKSSLVSTILRLLDLNSGSILIDGIDISRVSRSHVRSRLNTIPQEVFFLHGTIRLNANPEGDADDSTIIGALEEVNLWSYIESKGGLDEDMTEELLSHGQRQLFCLARALCKSSKILIMDEATSSVDAETDKLMQQVIRTHFKNQTIIAIAHKLDTVLDFDKIAFMDHGKVIEFDAPKTLLSREGSAFKKLFDSFRQESE
ncbi:P-loop containing nucleoside triphosphate hydrolase protein [Penicillium cosmopolitanum]|uniref:P-loop containing nucleoside triphosphate hydrolase protein n=1 Tax=Penicillium cosmopolitanum TaxID=1131564 RepID=A0A9W9W9H0_9EURO|nr:P-loop containing nucleoside triphosphate hydrolase protein [Penicillium cosmopolitanum]KAJ5408595.1 P-loop containing nucleoside triphosphate hydrolase protein [Penicillium cosmopolitanum]